MILDKLRVTEIGMALRCPMQLWHLKTLGPHPPSGAMFCGTCYHKALERNYKQKMTTGTNLKLSDLLGEYELNWDLGKDKVLFKEGEESVYKDRGIGCLTAYFASGRMTTLFAAEKQGIPLVEYPVIATVKMGEEAITITGTVDLVTKDKIAIDHKTAEKGWQNGVAEREPQAALYPFLLKNLNIDVNSFCFDIAYCDEKHNAGAQVATVAYNNERALALLKFAFRIKKMFELEIPIPNTRGGFHCREAFCGYYAQCEFGGGK